MLIATGLRKSFGGHLAVDGVDLRIETGSCFGLLGPNGAGKTTTISMIVGVLDPDAGSIGFEGSADLPTSAGFKRRIGYVPQELALYDDLTATENLRFFGLLYGLSGAELVARIEASLKIAGLLDRAKEPVKNFSGGMKRRLNISVALLHDPDLIVLDEPTVGVDPQSRNAIFDVLEELRAKGKTLLYTTHYMEEVERLCDRIAIMDHGKVVASGTLAELQKMIPGKRRISIEIEDQPAELAVGKVEKIPDVLEAEASGNTLTLDVERLEVALPGVLRALTESGFKYGSLESSRLTLRRGVPAVDGKELARLMGRISALVWKEIRLFLTDKKALVITFLVPIAIASFFGMIMGNSGGSSSGGAKKIAVLVADNDGSSLTKKIIDGMKADSMADPSLVSEKEARDRVASGKSGVAVIFPKGFGEQAPNAMFSGDQPVVEVIYDPTKSMEYQAVQGAIMQVAMQVVNQNAFSPDRDYTKQMVDIDSDPSMSVKQKEALRTIMRAMKNVPSPSSTTGSGGGPRQPFKLVAKAQSGTNSGEVAWAGMAHTFAGMAVQGVLFFGIDAAMGLLRDRRLGIWRRLRASPVSLGEILAGKALSSALLALLVLCGVLAFGMIVFGIRVLGSWLGLAAVLAATSLMVASFGLLVASLGRTEGQSRGFATLAVLMMTMLGGGWFPAFLMPAWVQTVSFFVPVRWAMDGFDAMLWRGSGISAVGVPIAGLFGFTIVFGVIALLRFQVIAKEG